MLGTAHPTGSTLSIVDQPLLNKIRGFSPSNINAQDYRNAVSNELWNETIHKLGNPPAYVP